MLLGRSGRGGDGSDDNSNGGGDDGSDDNNDGGGDDGSDDSDGSNAVFEHCRY